MTSLSRFVVCCLGTFIGLTPAFQGEEDVVYHLHAVEAHMRTHTSIAVGEKHYDVLMERYFDRLNLHEVTYEELQELGILTGEQIASFFAYVEDLGPLISIYELQAVPLWDIATVKLLLPFVQVPARPSLATQPVEHHKVSLSMAFKYPFYAKKKRGKKSKKVKKAKGNATQLSKERSTARAGSKQATQALPTWGWQAPPHEQLYALPLYEILHYDYHVPGKYKVKLVQRKKYQDLVGYYGHAPFGGYWSGSVMVVHQGRIKRLVVGDYQVTQGQGLILGSSFGVRKSGAVMSIVHGHKDTIKPLGSIQRKQGFRGVAMTVGQGPLETTLYCSRHLLDATLQRKKASSETHVRSVADRGMDDTLDKLPKKNTIQEQVIGACYTYQDIATGRRYGVQLLQQQYNKPVRPSSPYAFREDIFAGHSLTQAGGYAQGSWGPAYFFGEAAVSLWPGYQDVQDVLPEHKAILVGVLLSPTKRTGVALALRAYGPRYHAPHGNALGSNSKVRNEVGGYAGLELLQVPKTRIAGYVDYACHHHPQYQRPKPSYRAEALLRVEHHPYKEMLVSVQTKHKWGNLLPVQDKQGVPPRLPQQEDDPTEDPQVADKEEEEIVPLSEVLPKEHDQEKEEEQGWYYRHRTTLRMDRRLGLGYADPHLKIQVQYIFGMDKEGKTGHGIGVDVRLKGHTGRWQHEGTVTLYKAGRCRANLYFYAHDYLPTNAYPKLDRHGCKINVMATYRWDKQVRVRFQGTAMWNLQGAFHPYPSYYQLQVHLLYG